MSVTQPKARAVDVAYFAQRDSDGAVKIGHTRGIESRIRKLQSTQGGDPVAVLATYPGGSALEQWLHRKLREHRIDGEWYAPDPEVMDAAAGRMKFPDFTDPFAFARATPYRLGPPVRKGVRDETWHARNRREMIVNCYREGLSGHETADILGLSTNKLVQEIKLMSEHSYFNGVKRRPKLT